LVVAYSSQTGSYTKIGRNVAVDFTVITSVFTHTTASGALQFTGSPFAATINSIGNFDFQGITKANYTNYCSRITGGSATITVQASGSAQARSTVDAANMPTGGGVVVIGAMIYTA
jgi:hypothetical protein